MSQTDFASRVVVAMITRNEEAAVKKVIADINQHAPGAQILVVDSSSDRTPELAAQAGAKVIRQFPPAGYGPAMQAVLDAGAGMGEVVVTLDCDDTYPTEAIFPMAKMVLEDGWDLVNATRLERRPDAMPFPNYLANWLFAATTRAVHGLPTTDVHSGMRAYRASVLRSVPFASKGPALPVELLIKPARLGFRVAEVAIPYRERIGVTTLERFRSTWWTFRRIFALLAIGKRVGKGPGSPSQWKHRFESR